MADQVTLRHMQANYMNLGTSETPSWKFMGAGFKSLNESPGAQETSKRYINDKSNTTTITGYEFEASYEADMIKSEEVIKEIIDIGKYQKTGALCEREYLMVDLDEAGATEGTFKARKINVAILVDSFGDDDGEMNASGSLKGRGDIVPGEFNPSTLTFTATTVVSGD